MLDVQLAQKFIEKITKVTDYNVNIMNEKGYIIASRNPGRIGSFHEIAYDIIVKNREMMEVADDHTYVGVSPGINMGILYEGRCVGVVGVTGEPDKIREVALIIKMAMETMLGYEMQQEMSYRHRDTKKRFLDALIGGTDADLGQLRELGENLGYDEKLVRIPILCVFPGKCSAQEMLSRIKDGGGHSRQDISFITDKQQILIFKVLDLPADRLFAEYQFVLGEYLSTMLTACREQGEICRVYVGTFQNSFRNYRQAYGHCEWLEGNSRGNQIGTYFYDYVDEYFHSLVPFVELYKVFNIFEGLPEETKKHIVEIEGSLRKSNYNMVTSSRELCLHKNTLAFRFEKIKSLLEINPMKEYKDRFFLEYLQYYLKNQI